MNKKELVDHMANEHGYSRFDMERKRMTSKIGAYWTTLPGLHNEVHAKQGLKHDHEPMDF